MSVPFKIFPVNCNKQPLIKDWQKEATNDTHIISHWKAKGVLAWGIPCGVDNGLFVIDLDVDKTTGEPIGEANLMAMSRYAGLMEKANVRTPSGGKHIYCRHFDGAKNSTSRIAPKIDTRGQGGYVVAPGSHIASGVYQGYFPEVLPSVPIGLKAMLLHRTHPPKQQYGRLVPTGEVAELLAHIPADLSYQDWLSVLMALHDRFNGSEEGLILADQWSAAGDKYRPGEVATKWNSFKSSGVTWATVPALARQYGANLSAIARRWKA